MFIRVLTLTLAFLVVALASLNGLIYSFGDSPQFSFTLAGSFAIYLATRPPRRELFVTLLLGIMLRLAYGAKIGIHPYFGSAFISLAGFLGAAGIIVLAFKTVHSRDLSMFVAAAFFPFVTIVVGFILPITNALSPVTFDAHLLAVDGTLGFQPSFILGRIISRPQHLLLWNITATVYYALPLAIASLCAVQLTKDFSEVRRLLVLFGVMSVVGFCIYSACPATGPIYAFRQCFPLRPPNPADIQLAPLSIPLYPRNAMPSLHLSAALLVFWNTSGMQKSTRIAAGLFLVGTAFATLALGEHYVIDIIVAVPFSLMFQAAFTRPGREKSIWRYYAVLGSAGLVALWICMLRFYVEPLLVWPIATYCFFFFTLGFSILARRYQATREENENISK